MATMVCRGLQSCLDSHIVDQRTLLLMKFSSNSPQPHLISHSPHHPFEFPLNSGYSFSNIAADKEAISISDKCDNIEDEKIYVHPLSKRSNSTSLSDKSLKLCTENLGNETGADIIENFNVFLSEFEDGFNGNMKKEQKIKSHSHSHSHSHSYQKFPPPLTTIRESESWRVKPHREEGRLIIEAVKTPVRQSYFQADRSHGRLRLCFSRTEENEEIDEEEEEENLEGV